MIGVKWSKTVFFLFLFFPLIVGLVPAVLLFVGVISPIGQQYFIQIQGEPLALLKSYEIWYTIIFGVTIFNILFVGIVCVIHWNLLVKYRNSFSFNWIRKSLVLSVLSFALPLAILFAIIKLEKIPQRIAQVKEDIQQIETGQMEQRQLWLTTQNYKGSLPGPQLGEEIQVVTEYRGIGESSQHQWRTYYLPLSIPFTLEQKNQFDVMRSISWNKENVQQYLVTYTTNLGVITDIRPIEIAE